MPPATFTPHFSPAALLFGFSGHNFRVNRILFLHLNCSIVTEHHMSQSECHGVSRLISLRERKWSRVVSPMVRLQLSTGSYLSQQLSGHSPLCTCRAHLLPSVPFSHWSAAQMLSADWLQVSLSLSGSGSRPGSTGSFRERKQDTSQNKSPAFLLFLKHKEGT